MRKPTVQYPASTRKPHEVLTGRRVGRAVQPRPGLARVHYRPGAVPGQPPHVNVDVDRERAGGPVRIVALLAKSEMQVIRHPRGEEAGPHQFAEVVTALDSVTRLHLGLDVENSGQGLAGVDHDQVVVLGGVGFRRRPDGPRVDHLPRHGRGRALAVGIEVDRTAAVVGRERGVVEREPPVAIQDVPSDDDRRSPCLHCLINSTDRAYLLGDRTVD